MKSASFLKSGFTLLELTIVIAVIGIISTLLYSNWNVSREKARVAEVAKNTRSIKDQLAQKPPKCQNHKLFHGRKHSRQ